jgi:hypothetical protein
MPGFAVAKRQAFEPLWQRPSAKGSALKRLLAGTLLLIRQINLNRKSSFHLQGETEGTFKTYGRNFDDLGCLTT